MPIETGPRANRPGPPITETTSPDNAGRRSGTDRRCFSYTAYIPERRNGGDRRAGEDQRRMARPPSGRNAGDAGAAEACRPPRRAAPRS